jgi:hypothetical protein
MSFSLTSEAYLLLELYILTPFNEVSLPHLYWPICRLPMRCLSKLFEL